MDLVGRVVWLRCFLPVLMVVWLYSKEEKRFPHLLFLKVTFSEKKKAPLKFIEHDYAP